MSKANHELSYSAHREYEAEMAAFGGAWFWDGKGQNVVQGDRISFTTLTGLHVESATVLDVDLLAVYPLRLEYIADNGDKRIERFAAHEFASFERIEHDAS